VTGALLVVNAGSSSIKFALFDAALDRLVSGIAAEIGGEATLTVEGSSSARPLADHRAAFAAILDALAARGHGLDTLAGAAHRVVHGGRHLTAPCRLDAAAIAAIRACAPLAPLHNPHNLAAIEALVVLAPGLLQFASFDTAFHADNPEVALRYGVPDEVDAAGIRRYGFHGISYGGLVERLPALAGGGLPRRLLALHLGNGASLCAIRDGRSVATTMGYSPLDGLTMGSRCGAIDGNAVLRLVEARGLAATADLLNRRSGLLGLGGASDMRVLAAMGTKAARFAIDHFCYWAVRHAGSMVAAMGGIDALAFTGGIGENDAAVRAAIMDGLAFLGVDVDAKANAARATLLTRAGSAVAAYIVPADEERTIAANARALIRA